VFSKIEQRNPKTIFHRDSGVEQDDFGQHETDFDQRCQMPVKKKNHSYTTKLIQQFATIFGGVANKRAGIDGNRHDSRMW